MSGMLGWAGAVLVVAGTVLTTLATIGVLRFPDLLTRLHALTNADNVGLALCVIGLSLIGGDPAAAAIMLIVWSCVMFSGASAAHLVARRHLEREEEK